ncbi:TadE family protein [Streptomyces sp. TP-A0874]|uniref:TadE family protein n=1 Tax=Streptomyces sp. TP-A0874 TaxID=549819 RepID=UPI0008532DC1|nr:TadE family protein [Streptomyces sp. TP-A0874]
MRLRRKRSDRGQVAVEYIGMLPILIVIGLGVIQFGLVAYTIQQAASASRAAARTASHDHPAISYEQAGRGAMSGWLADRASFTQSTGPSYDEVKVTATVRIPSIIPGVDFGETKRSTTMPRD